MEERFRIDGVDLSSDERRLASTRGTHARHDRLKKTRGARRENSKHNLEPHPSVLAMSDREAIGSSSDDDLSLPKATVAKMISGAYQRERVVRR